MSVDVVTKDYQLPKIDKPNVNDPIISVENIANGIIHTYWLPNQQMEDSETPKYQPPDVTKFPLQNDILYHPNVVRIISEDANKTYTLDFALTAILQSPTLVADLFATLEIAMATDLMTTGLNRPETQVLSTISSGDVTVVGSVTIDYYAFNYLLNTLVTIDKFPYQRTLGYTYFNDIFGRSYSVVQFLPILIAKVRGYALGVDVLIFPEDHFPEILEGWIIDTPPDPFFDYINSFIDESIRSFITSNCRVYGTLEGRPDDKITRLTITGGPTRNANIINGNPEGQTDLDGIDPDMLIIDLDFFPVDDTTTNTQLNFLFNQALMKWLHDFDGSDVYVDHFYIATNNLVLDV